MSADVNVKSIQLLESYERSFHNYSSVSQQKINSYLALLGNSADKARQFKNRIHSIAERRKSYLSRAKLKLAAAMASDPPVFERIIVAKKSLDGCKKAYDKARQSDEQCEQLYKKLVVEIEQAKQQCLAIRTELSSATERGDSFLSGYISKLRDYSHNNG